MSEQFTLYRGESGAPHAVAFRCAHRGTQLSTGWVEGDDLRCFYHGWKYTGDGQCIEQPAEPEPFCNRIRIKSYPVQQYLGLVFVYMGEGEPPEIMRHPEFEDETEIRQVVIREPWPCNFFNRLENAPDSVHLTFAHFQLGYEVPIRMEAEETEFGIETSAYHKDGSVQHDHLTMPNISQFELPGWIGNVDANRLTWRVPIDDEHYMDVLVTQVHCTPDEVARLGPSRWEGRSSTGGGYRTTPELGETVLRGDIKSRELDQFANGVETEDYVTLVGQGAIPQRENDHLGRSDVGVVLLRKLWERELRLFAEGKPTKRWVRPARLEDLRAPVRGKGR
jgi:5,5'-dehydrodivanillate O-demethylase